MASWPRGYSRKAGGGSGLSSWVWTRKDRGPTAAEQKAIRDFQASIDAGKTLTRHADVVKAKQSGTLAGKTVITDSRGMDPVTQKTKAPVTVDMTPPELKPKPKPIPTAQEVTQRFEYPDMSDATPGRAETITETPTKTPTETAPTQIQSDAASENVSPNINIFVPKTNGGDAPRQSGPTILDLAMLDMMKPDPAPVIKRSGPVAQEKAPEPMTQSPLLGAAALIAGIFLL